MTEPSGLRIGSFAGAAIIVEPTFLFLGLYVLGSAVLSGGIASIGGALVFLAALVLAVLLHEIGHAGVAAALKIPSKRIVLTFFGGYVQFEHAARKRWHEIAVSAAGPLTNLLCWGIASAFVPEPYFSSDLSVMNALNQFAYVSLILGAFNLLPAFPLDGGHILRSVLSYFMSRDRAGMSAASVGLLFAVAIIAYGLWAQLWWTALMGGLLALTAWAEIQRARQALAFAALQPPTSNA